MLQIKVGTFLNAARSAWILSGICWAGDHQHRDREGKTPASINVSSPRSSPSPRNLNPRSLGRSSRFAGNRGSNLFADVHSCGRDVIETLRIRNLIPLRLLRPGALCQGFKRFSFFQHFSFVGFLETFRIPSFLLSNFRIPIFRPCSLLHAPLRALSPSAGIVDAIILFALRSSHRLKQFKRL